MRLPIASIPAFCAALVCLHARQAPAQESGNSRGVRFVCAAVAKDTPDVLQLRTSGGLKEMPLSIRSPGVYFPAEKDGSIALGVATGNIDHPFRPLALAKIPEDVTRATAILFPREKQPDGTCYGVFLVDETNLKGGEVYLLNMLPDRCVAKIDGTTLYLECGKPVIHRTKGETGTHNSPVAIGVEKKDLQTGANSWEMITASTWRLMPTRVEICVIYMNSDYRRPALKGLTLFIDRENPTP